MIPDLKINQSLLKKAVDIGIISSEQSDKLWQLFEKEVQNTPQFRIGHVLYYLGGLLSIGAVTFLMGLVWDKLKGLPLLSICAILFIVGLKLTNIFKSKKLIIPSGILASFSLVLVPLMVYNIQYILHMAPDQYSNYENVNYLICARWVPMELVTLIIGVVLFYFYRFNFILLPISVILWYLSMDLYQVIFKLKIFTFTNSSWFSLIFGLIELIFLIKWDYKIESKDSDQTFWLYIAATLTFWGGLSGLNSNYHVLGHFIYLAINLIMLIISVLLQRRIFAVCATVGIFWYLLDITENSIVLPFILIFIGFFIIYAATKWSKIEDSFIKRYNRLLPKRFRY